MRARRRRLDPGTSWTALRRSVLLVQGARENAHDAMLADQFRAAQRRRAAITLAEVVGERDAAVTSAWGGRRRR